MNTILDRRLPTRRFRARWAAGVASAGLCLAATGASATPLSITSVVGGAPMGAHHENFDALTAGDTTTATLASGITISFGTDAQPVAGAKNGLYAPPFLSGDNGVGFGAPDQADGADATTYISTGSTGAFPSAAVTLLFPKVEKYMGILWGSVDSYNALTFYSGGSLLGTISGGDVSMATGFGNCAGGVQDSSGTCYVNINSAEGFDRVVMTSSQYAFEFDNVAFSETPIGVPEPGALGMMGAGMLAIVGLAIRRRKLPVE